MEFSMFNNLSYLKKGTVIQRRTYSLLKEYQVFEKLVLFNPILIGTIPIDISTPSSDLDIACEVYDLNKFEQILKKSFGNHKDYRFKLKTIHGKDVGIANFKIADQAIEIYGESCSVFEQNGYRHMIVEHQILNHYGSDFKRKILELKSSGWKTEPAFAELLNLDGDPYTSLLSYTIENDEN